MQERLLLERERAEEEQRLLQQRINEAAEEERRRAEMCADTHTLAVVHASSGGWDTSCCVHACPCCGSKRWPLQRADQRSSLGRQLRRGSGMF